MMNTTSSTARTIGGIVVGYLTFAVGAVLIFALSGRDAHAAVSPWFLAVSVVAGVILALGAGYIAGRVARRADNLAGIAVASIIALGAVVSLAFSPGGGAIWSQLAALVLMAPAAVVGGRWGRGLRFQV
jgi:hypothetical protein